MATNPAPNTSPPEEISAPLPPAAVLADAAARRALPKGEPGGGAAQVAAQEGGAL
ncbi:MAG: hypothetical protein ACJ8AT_35555 [Hyalangium sp.]|uniref:hypothetical protein n=1 Tax=Hyalangium sp. TaxID=2028555 RepID=UPI00389AFA90